MRSSTLQLGAAALLCALWGLTGCQQTHVPDSTLPKLAGNEPMTQLDFWHELALRPMVSNDEAFHGLLLYIDEKDDAQTYADRVAAMKSRHLLASNFNEPGDAPLTHGTLSIPLVNYLKLKRSIALALLGDNERYASRQLEFEGIYPTSSPNQVFTGASFVGVIGKAEDYRTGNPADYPAKVMPGEIKGTAVVSRWEGEAPADPSFEALTQPIFAMLQPENLSLRPSTAATTNASTAPAGTKALITAVQGIVSYRESENDAWKAAVKGVELSEQAELRTGPHGAIQLFVEPDQTIAIDRVTTIKLVRLLREGASAITDIGIKYGRARYDLEGGGIEHRSTLRSPNATLAVRGTRVSLFDQPPFTPTATSLTGTAQFQGYRKRAVAFGARGQGRTRVRNDQTSPGALAIQESTVDPTLPGARTQSEIPLLENLISRGSTVTSESGLDIPVVTGGVPPTDQQLLSLLPGRLNFVVRWDGNADLNLAVSVPGTPATPGGELIYPIQGFTHSASGGQSAFDHRGGPNGGIEIVYFKDTFPTGFYGLAAPSSSATPVNAILQGFLDGQPLELFGSSASAGGFPVISNRIDQEVANPNPGPGLALAAVPGPFPPGFAPPPPPPAPPRKASAAPRTIDIANPPKAVMVGPKPAGHR